MLSRLVTCCGQRLCASPGLPKIGQLRFNRFDRAQLRSRLHKESKLQSSKNSLPYKFDLIPVRPPKHLWRTLGFTLAVGGASFTVASITDFQRAKRRMRRFWDDTVDMFGAQMQTQQYFADEWWVKLTDGQKTCFLIVAANAMVFLLWKVKPLEPFMWRWFTNSYASKSLCLPMVLSAFSHSHWLHLGLNMYVLYSFAGVSIDRFMGMDQCKTASNVMCPCHNNNQGGYVKYNVTMYFIKFMAFYLTAASVSSMTSLIHKCAIGSSVRALGASGAILGVLAYTCVKIPDARLQIVFVPQLNFSAESAIIGLLLFDLAGLVLRFRMFDHAAHLGGALFGIFYGLYGENIIWRRYGERVLAVYRRLTEKKR